MLVSGFSEIVSPAVSPPPLHRCLTLPSLKKQKEQQKCNTKGILSCKLVTEDQDICFESSCSNRVNAKQLDSISGALLEESSGDTEHLDEDRVKTLSLPAWVRKKRSPYITKECTPTNAEQVQFPHEKCQGISLQFYWLFFVSNIQLNIYWKMSKFQ